MSVNQFIPAIKYGNLVDSTDVNPALVQTATITLSSSQITGMFASPVTLVTTTAPGQAIVVESCLLEALNTTTTFTSGGAIIVGYNGSTATNSGVLLSTFPGAVLTATTAGYYVQEASTTTSGALTVQANAGITIGNQTAAFAGGTGTAKVFLNYYVITL